MLTVAKREGLINGLEYVTNLYKIKIDKTICIYNSKIQGKIQSKNTCALYKIRVSLIIEVIYEKWLFVSAIITQQKNKEKFSNYDIFLRKYNILQTILTI